MEWGVGCGLTWGDVIGKVAGQLILGYGENLEEAEWSRAFL